MSNNDPKNPVIVVGANAQETPESEEKQSFVAKTKAFVKNHKKPAIALGAFVGLVGVTALATKRTEPLPGFETTLAFEPPHVSIDTELTESEQDPETA